MERFVWPPDSFDSTIIRLFVNRPCAHAQWMDEEEEGESDELLFLSKEEEEEVKERRKWLEGIERGERRISHDRGEGGRVRR